MSHCLFRKYIEHEKAIKLLYALDRSVWDLKVNTIIESAGYETLIVNELFSKLKATEVDNQTRAKLNGAPSFQERRSCDWPRWRIEL